MLKSVDIRNFKGIRELDEPISLSKITVLVGRNESGKSSILEAIYLAASATQGFVDPIARTSTLNTLSRRYLSLRNLIFKGSSEFKIELDIENQGKIERIVVLAAPYEEVLRKNVENYGPDIVKNLNDRLARLRRDFIRMKRRLQRLERITRLMTMLSMELVQLVHLEEVSPSERDLERDIERKLEVYSSELTHDTLYLCSLINYKISNLALAVSHRHGSLTSVVGTRAEVKVNPILIDVIERGRALPQRILKLALEYGLGGKIRDLISKYVEVIEDLDFIPGSSLVEPVKCIVKYRGVDKPIEIDLCSYGIRSFITMILACVVAEQDKNSIILIEEPENTLHLGLLRKLSEALVEFSSEKKCTDNTKHTQHTTNKRNHTCITKRRKRPKYFKYSSSKKRSYDRKNDSHQLYGRRSYTKHRETRL